MSGDFLARWVARRRIFLALSLAGLAVAGALTAYYAWRRGADPDYPLATRCVIVLLILLNARANLRQFRVASALARQEEERT